MNLRDAMLAAAAVGLTYGVSTGVKENLAAKGKWFQGIVVGSVVTGAGLYAVKKIFDEK